MPEVTTLTVVGDIMVARRVGEAIADDPRQPFRPLAPRLAGADITVGNLESTLSTDGSPTQGGDSFGGPGCCGGWTPPDLIWSPWPTTTSGTTGTGHAADVRPGCGRPTWTMSGPVAPGPGATA